MFQMKTIRTSGELILHAFSALAVHYFRKWAGTHLQKPKDPELRIKEILYSLIIFQPDSMPRRLRSPGSKRLIMMPIKIYCSLIIVRYALVVFAVRGAMVAPF